MRIRFLCAWHADGVAAQRRGGAQQAGNCPQIQIFGARETTTPQGFGSAITLIELVQKRFPGTVAEEIVYPALGDDLYSRSAGEGILAVIKQTSAFAARCPQSIIIMHGYSQGAQIMDDAFCGGPDLPQLESAVPLISRATANNTAAIILMGNPRFVPGLPFNVGNATAGGFAARPADFKCPLFENRIQSYCDSPDPFCSNGNDPETHQQYGFKFGKDALDFIVSKLVAN
ncbi:catalytic core domain of acetyl xylan esterase [Cercophora newfieldiana]|uniref:Catalytic core domain of acetyl xylan esterase n=1 Tax=Cercophora newfieldiana TaxID=92897 RepID=A0AA39Y6H3_9PEZI|nr:catalytic core domain of acetyl xylan esterase [Cercophora newfieldiana]